MSLFCLKPSLSKHGYILHMVASSLGPALNFKLKYKSRTWRWGFLFGRISPLVDLVRMQPIAGWSLFFQLELLGYFSKNLSGICFLKLIKWLSHCSWESSGRKFSSSSLEAQGDILVPPQEREWVGNCGNPILVPEPPKEQGEATTSKGILAKPVGNDPLKTRRSCRGGPRPVPTQPCF